jgi:hypothetical protein
MQAVTAIAAPDRTSSSDPILDHLVDCDTCLSVIVDLDLPTAACETRCKRLRELLSGGRARQDRMPASHGTRVLAFK